MSSNISADLLWEIVRHNHSMLHKRRHNGGVQFSHDPLNLLNLHTRKHAGFINDQAIGIHPSPDGGISLVTKRKGISNPSKSTNTIHYRPKNSSRRTYKNIANATAKQHYRADLRAEAIARASAIEKSRQPVKPDAKEKLRGAKARKDLS